MTESRGWLVCEVGVLLCPFMLVSCVLPVHSVWAMSTIPNADSPLWAAKGQGLPHVGGGVVILQCFEDILASFSPLCLVISSCDTTQSGDHCGSLESCDVVYLTDPIECYQGLSLGFMEDADVDSFPLPVDLVDFEETLLAVYLQYLEVPAMCSPSLRSIHEGQNHCCPVTHVWRHIWSLDLLTP